MYIFFEIDHIIRKGDETMAKNPPENENVEPENDDLRICSSMECTGLIPALPEDDGQLEAYEELYPFLAKPSDQKTT